MDRTDFGCEVEAQVAVVGQSILNEQRYLVRQAKSYPARQTARLAEVDKILEGEGQGDRLCQLDLDILVRLLDIAVAAECDRSGTDVSVTGKLDTLLCALNSNCRLHERRAFR